MRSKGARAGLLVAGSAAALAGAALLRRRRRLDLTGRVVLITGGSRGLGLELGRQFADEGAHIALLARDEAALERAGLELAGVPLDLLPCDLADFAQVRRAVGELVRRHGRLDVLVNVASTIRVGPIENLGVEAFHEEMANNFFGTLHAVYAALPHLERGVGRIVNVTSIGGRIPVPHLTPYTAAKFAAVGFSEALHAELEANGIRVTTVTPGLMRTGSPYRAMFGGRREQEFRWFLLLSSLPGLSMGSRHVARKIVAACKRGDASLILPAYLRVPIAAHALAPGLFAQAAGLASRLLPGPAEAVGEELREGKEVLPPERSPAYAALTRRAARRNNELE
ncbi:MAG TPA: SDR family oxidoreductase [Trueperaceae bacterium]